MQAKRFIILILLVWASGSLSTTLAQEIIRQDPIDINCGDIIESEFTLSHEQQRYVLKMSPGDQIAVSVVPLGDHLKTAAFLYDMALEAVFAISDKEGRLFEGKYYVLSTETNPQVSSGVLSASGEYLIAVINYAWVDALKNSGGLGLYTLYVSCTLRDGTVINAGDTLSAVENPAQEPAPDTAPVSVSSPLVPTDLSNAAQIPLILDTPLTGIITSNEVIGFTFDSQGSETIDLSFARVSGNLNLGIVVLSESNQVLFYGGLIASEFLSTKLTLPAGQYTIGVFRIDLIPPATPEATTFQVQGTLNP
jgi:hypothetical protein